MKLDVRVMLAAAPRWIWSAAILGLGGFGQPAGGAEVRVHPRDTAWVDPQLDQRQPVEVALLPAVAFADDPQALRLVEVYGALLLAETGHAVQPAWRVREAMDGTGSRPDLYQSMARQVRASGAVEAGMASRLARLTGAPALLSLRIDRWEVVDGRAQVELTGALVDSSGRLLWKITGLAGNGGGGPSRAPGLEPASAALVDADGTRADRDLRFHPQGPPPWFARIAGARLEPEWGGDPQRALASLMSRWIPAIPHGAGDPDTPALAVASAGHESHQDNP